MVTSYQTIVLCALVAGLFHTCSALFYTNSRENDYPRIGKRHHHLANVLKSPSDWYRAAKLSEYQKPEPEQEIDEYILRTVLAAIQEENKVAVDPGLVTRENKEGLLKKIRHSDPSTYDSMRDVLNRILKQKYTSLEEDDLLPEF